MKQLNVPEADKSKVVEYFKHKTVSVSEVRKLMDKFSVEKNTGGTVKI
jgi:hypothetical protein